MTRFVLSSLRAIGFAAVAVCAAGARQSARRGQDQARRRTRRQAAPQARVQRPEGRRSKPSLVATFGDWNVFVGEAGKGRICYTLAQPKSREPASLKRDPGYAFISDRPAEGVRNEVSFIMGFDIASGDRRRRPDA